MQEEDQTLVAAAETAAISTGEDRVHPDEVSGDEVPPLAEDVDPVDETAAPAAEVESDVQLPDMDDTQLEQVHKAVADRIRQRRESSRQADLNTIHSLIAKHGFKASEVRVPKETKGTKVAAKYRNPADASQTWTGRGKPPAWIAGFDKDARAQFLIES